MAYPNVNSYPEFFKITNKNDEIEEIKFKLEKHDYEKIVKW